MLKKYIFVSGCFLIIYIVFVFANKNNNSFNKKHQNKDKTKRKQKKLTIVSQWWLIVVASIADQILVSINI